MSNKEFDQYLEKIEKVKKQIVASPKESEKFLTEIGILTPTGKVRKKYKKA